MQRVGDFREGDDLVGDLVHQADEDDEAADGDSGRGPLHTVGGDDREVSAVGEQDDHAGLAEGIDPAGVDGASLEDPTLLLLQGIVGVTELLDFRVGEVEAFDDVLPLHVFRDRHHHGVAELACLIERRPDFPRVVNRHAKHGQTGRETGKREPGMDADHIEEVDRDGRDQHRQ